MATFFEVGKSRMRCNILASHLLDVLVGSPETPSSTSRTGAKRHRLRQRPFDHRSRLRARDPLHNIRTYKRHR